MVPSGSRRSTTSAPPACRRCARTGIPRFFRLLERWREASGVPVLLNTSFNLRGEPIVTTPANALSTFQESGLDLLVLGNFVARKS